MKINIHVGILPGIAGQNFSMVALFISEYIIKHIEFLLLLINKYLHTAIYIF